MAKTFREAVVATHAAKADGWATKTADAFLTSMQDHAYPVLGDLLVEHIEAADIARALKTIWTGKPAMAVKVRHRIGTVLSFAKASNWRTTDAPMPELRHLLSRQEAGGAMAAMPYADVPAFMASLEAAAPSSGRSALLFAIATAARSGEVRQARWEQIDFAKRLWNRPADIMKGRVAHSVTLSDYALGLTLAQGLGRSVWVAAGMSMMPHMVFPPVVRSVVIGADGNAPGEAPAQKGG